MGFLKEKYCVSQECSSGNGYEKEGSNMPKIIEYYHWFFVRKKPDGVKGLVISEKGCALSPFLVGS